MRLSCTRLAFRAQVTLDGGAATVAAELTLRPRAADGSGAMDLAATPTIWRLFGRCEPMLKTRPHAAEFWTWIYH